MKLDRNITTPRRGKYAIVKLRNINQPIHGVDVSKLEINTALEVLEKAGILDYGNTIDTDFFLIRLKDKYAFEALKAYAIAAASDDIEYANQIFELSEIAMNHTSKRKPD